MSRVNYFYDVTEVIPAADPILYSMALHISHAISAPAANPVELKLKYNAVKVSQGVQQLPEIQWLPYIESHIAESNFNTRILAHERYQFL